MIHTAQHILQLKEFVLAACSVAAIMSPRLIRRFMDSRSGAGDYGSTYSAEHLFVPNIRIVSRGPQIGMLGEQPIFEWLDVLDAAGARKRLGFSGDTSLKNMAGMLVFKAGPVTYAEHVDVSDPTPGQARHHPCIPAVAMELTQEETA